MVPIAPSRKLQKEKSLKLSMRVRQQEEAEKKSRENNVIYISMRNIVFEGKKEIKVLENKNKKLEKQNNELQMQLEKERRANEKTKKKAQGKRVQES